MHSHTFHRAFHCSDKWIRASWWAAHFLNVCVCCTRWSLININCQNNQAKIKCWRLVRWHLGVLWIAIFTIRWAWMNRFQSKSKFLTLFYYFQKLNFMHTWFIISNSKKPFDFGKLTMIRIIELHLFKTDFNKPNVKQNSICQSFESHFTKITALI